MNDAERSLRRMLAALGTMFILLVAVFIATGVLFFHRQEAQQQRSDRKTCQSINEGRAGSRTAIGVVRDIVNNTPRPATTTEDPFHAQPGADPALVQLIDDLNGFVEASRANGGAGTEAFRDDANAAIDKAIRNLQPVECG